MAFFMCHTTRTFSTFLRKIPAKQLIISSILKDIDSPINKITKLSSGNVLLTSIRHSNYRSSPLVDQIDKSTLPDVEIIQNPAEWEYVERILAPSTIPSPIVKNEYPSGWTPQTVDPNKTSYFLQRTKNHMIPVYLEIFYRGTKRVTTIRRIKGDIWALDADLTKLVESYRGRKIVTRVNEFSGSITIRGDYVNLVKDYLIKKGF